LSGLLHLRRQVRTFKGTVSQWSGLLHPFTHVVRLKVLKEQSRIGRGYSIYVVRLALSTDLKGFFLFEVGCALTFASEAKFENEAKISFRLEAKKSLISHDSLGCETLKI
jgi:hypothetical protein